MWIAFFIGTLLGFLSGLGIGGGSLLILWLTLAQGVSPEEARTANLLFFLPAAVTAGFFRWRQGAVEPKKLLPALLGGSAGALSFSFLSLRLDTALLRRLFGGLLIVTGLRELFYRPNAKREGQ